MARLDLSTYLDDDSVTIPGIPSKAHPDGRDYTITSPDAKTGMRLAAMADLGIKAHAGTVSEADVAALQLDDDEERDLYRMVLGDTLDELVADGVSWARIQKLGRYLFVHYSMGEEAAAEAVNRSGGATAPANRAARRATKKTATPKASPAGSTTRGRKKP